MKKAITIIASLILALITAFVTTYFLDGSKAINANVINQTSLVPQEVLSYSDVPNRYHKIYDKGELIAVLTDEEHLNALINEKYKDYEADFPDTTLGLSDDVCIVEETSYAAFSNVDEQIMEYLSDHDLLGVKTTAVEFSDSNGIYEIIYVKDYEDFAVALERFYSNFIADETLARLRRGEVIDSPSELGSVQTGVSLRENITTKDSIVAPSQIYKNTDEIYEFLCYGHNESREYYTVKEGDTLSGVGYYFGDMSPEQLVMINPNVLTSENQIITPGMHLNVTYYLSPINVDVTSERLSQQLIAPQVPEYIEDPDLEAGVYEVRVEEENGIKNVLYEEKWTNGVLQSGEILSEKTLKEPKQGVIAVGTKQVIMVGTGNYIWPVDKPHITCHWGCYLGHTGTDMTNRYEKYAPIYAVDSGVVDETGYRSDMGNYVIINHQNGVRTFYMHLNVPAYVETGSNVARGQIIGQMGNTGYSDGVHLHLTFEINGTRMNACNFLPCGLLN